ncbi:acetate/propionate family kinase [Halomonas sp.]|uniref:acetate/propionate family kinase n=1 Tax=Halomonas sp. TaxID=1486246 RepID=UPI00298E443E|nr:acetate/propionate family kinase [Halomonas sp.]MDW7746441.1 acetate/propionate family kinase [Halomonas sp.]
MSRVLVLNAGSATLKFGLYDEMECRMRGVVERIGEAPALRLVSGGLDAEGFAPTESGHAAVAEALLDWLGTHFDLGQLAGVGHRVVHGGTRLAEPVRLDSDRLAYLEGLEPLAPLHQPQSLSIIRDLLSRHPTLPQVACFDTAFHRTQPRVRQLFALPRHLADEGVLRYGFHGLSYAHVARQLPAVVGEAAARGRVVVAHLGQGCSLCALENGRSVATSMGFTALDGMMMGSRCGRLDPGVVLYLQQRGMSVAEVERMLYHDSGLLGVSGISADMRDLLESHSPHAEEAVALFIDRLLGEIGALVALLGGLDALVFTGGIGEHAAEIRGRTLHAMEWLGIRLDGPANARHALRIDAGRGPAVAVIPTDEEGEMARGTLACLDPR